MSNIKGTIASRRTVIRAGLSLGLGAVALTGFASTASAQKVDKTAVMYQDTPKDGLKCSGCVNFVAPNACKIVEGEINPNGWCGAYAPKEG